ncbi:hypothetical protein [Candidatus Neptunochlamydia vexilliferae]|uniref:Uncharacterized protein n=1 Tax=Candidatus Neptunichlamydia vexilliferae TaxID=1651774 RepID=A0ABS0AXX0_9BACT|nr:hypothetical protein [Candidatus Neptunochlamydia vexilliferae]MBF5058985.1 hypothetical protein [Candidatus Neptunochlamydia vexilliferae]
MGVCQSQRSRFSSLEAVSYRRDRGDAEGVKDGDAGAGKNQFLNLLGYQIIEDDLVINEFIGIAVI